MRRPRRCAGNRLLKIEITFQKGHVMISTMAKGILVAFFVTATALPQAQTAQTAKPAPPLQLGAYGGWFGHAGVTCGAGASSSSVSTKPTAQCGALMTLMPLPVDLEVGVMGPQANRSKLSSYLSANAWIPLIPPKDLGNK